MLRSWLRNQGAPYSKEADMAKLSCSELAMTASLDAIQVMGGDGYTSDCPVERIMRDAKICEIGDGYE
ncbi:MAG: acyl-CoA dehydrogenase family protein [Longimicrobiales bacterium]|nr:acyl-CoA dehydrogenase family protein [Longimicrobiales bacterium]